jgi:hypothetical protein
MDRKFEKTFGVAAGALAVAACGMAFRPWFLSWGATEEEIDRFWPGDELSPKPASSATRAITIRASADEVWPWLAQIGQDRGGFYSYSWLENLVGARIHNADRLLPGQQGRLVGDTVWMTPRERYGGRGCVRVARVEPDRDMVFVSPEDYDSAVTKGLAPNGTWAFVLDSIDERTTRLIVRSRSGAKANPLRFLLFDPAHFIMERKMMLGIRDRAEAQAARRIEAKAA